MEAFHSSPSSNSRIIRTNNSLLLSLSSSPIESPPPYSSFATADPSLFPCYYSPPITPSTVDLVFTSPPPSPTTVLVDSPRKFHHHHHHHPQFMHHQKSSTLLSPSSHSSRSSTRSITSPLASIENLPTTPLRPSKTPPLVKVEDEDVLVMDGILVVKSPSPSPSPVATTNSRVRTASAAIARSPTLDSSGVSSPGAATTYQFTHRKENLRPTRYSIKSKPEVQVQVQGQGSKMFGAAGGRSMYGTNYRFLHHSAAVNETVLEQKAEQQSGTIDWSPADDSIAAVCLPSSSTGESHARGDVDVYINSILYGPCPKQRLPVFKEICPE